MIACFVLSVMPPLFPFLCLPKGVYGFWVFFFLVFLGCLNLCLFAFLLFSSCHSLSLQGLTVSVMMFVAFFFFAELRLLAYLA
jgi:hypothetical protein